MLPQRGQADAGDRSRGPLGEGAGDGSRAPLGEGAGDRSRAPLGERAEDSSVSRSSSGSDPAWTLEGRRVHCPKCTAQGRHGLLSISHWDRPPDHHASLCLRCRLYVYTGPLRPGSERQRKLPGWFCVLADPDECLECLPDNWVWGTGGPSFGSMPTDATLDAAAAAAAEDCPFEESC